MNTEKMTMLYNTLCLIEVKGESAIRMGDCLKFVKEAIEDAAKESNTKAKG